MFNFPISHTYYFFVGLKRQIFTYNLCHCFPLCPLDRTDFRFHEYETKPKWENRQESLVISYTYRIRQQAKIYEWNGSQAEWGETIEQSRSDQLYWFPTKCQKWICWHNNNSDVNWWQVHWAQWTMCVTLADSFHSIKTYLLCIRGLVAMRQLEFQSFNQLLALSTTMGYTKRIDATLRILTDQNWLNVSDRIRLCRANKKKTKNKIHVNLLMSCNLFYTFSIVSNHQISFRSHIYHMYWRSMELVH